MTSKSPGSVAGVSGLEAVPAAAAIGAEIRGVDPAPERDEAASAAIHRTRIGGTAPATAAETA